MDETTMDIYQETADFLRDKVPKNLQKPKVAIICGSGLGGLASTVHEDGKVELDYASIPHFSRSQGKKSRGSGSSTLESD
jgi:purine-nucleoside phosphorylase